MTRLAGILLLMLALTACTTDATPTPPPATPAPQPTSAPTSALPAPSAALPTALPPTTAPPTGAAPTTAPPTGVPVTAMPTGVPTTGAAPTETPPTAMTTGEATAVPTSQPATTAPPTGAAETAVPTGPPETAVPTGVPATQPPNGSPTPEEKLITDGFGKPDDLTVATDGTLYFSDTANGSINRIPPGGGTPEPIAAGLLEPEGIAVTPDDKLIVEEQKTNSIFEFDPASGSKRLIRQLENTTGKDGVDGLAYDRNTGDILVPDSPNGRLLTLSRDGLRLNIIATGFDRPAGAGILPNGDLLVADEFGNKVYRVTRAGQKTALATMYQPDDVVVDGAGFAYVNALDGTIYRLDPRTGALKSLLTGLKSPHGLAVDPQGRIVIAETDRNIIFSIAP